MTTSSSPMLLLSPHVLPQLRQGSAIMSPQNLAGGEDRIAFARDAISLIQGLVAAGNVQEAFEMRQGLWFADYVTKWVEDPDTGAVRVDPMPEFENLLGAVPSELGFLLSDGRLRDDEAMAYLQVGEDLPLLAGVLRRLHRGVRRDELLADEAAIALGFDEALVESLMARGVLEVVAEVPPLPVTDAAAGVRWMGHAYVCAQAGRANVWFDPFPQPRLAWSDKELATVFRQDLPDSFLLADYGPNAHHVVQAELPVPDAIFVTHQDVDHIDLGALALVPPEVPIYVPASDPSAPWQIDLVAAVRAILGDNRNVNVMRHGETIALGELKVTAFPFIGEFPAALPHQWNCYYLELPNQTWALCADSAVTPAQVTWLAAKRKDDQRPFGLMANRINERAEMSRGYSEGHLQRYSNSRVYSWYLRPVDFFCPTPSSGLPLSELKALVRDAGLTHVYPYAHGNLPWYRMKGTYALMSHVGSHSMGAFKHFEALAGGAGAVVPRLMHGRLWQPEPA